jgi:hypothetical protein
VGSPDPHLRVGNAEREQAVQVLGEHFAQGRLDPQEFEDRTTAAYSARTAGDLDALFTDLPRLAPPEPTRLYPVPPVAVPPGAVPAPAYDPEAPFGREPVTGWPYSDKSKTTAGLLQLFLPVGVGRFYTGHIAIGMAQLLLALFFGVGVIWAFVDGIVLLAGRPRDPAGRPLRP